MNIERYRCFGATALNGNDALVVSGPELAGWSLEDRQQFTIEQHAHACVFVDADGPESGQLTLDFYYPHARSPLCLHASLAAADHIWKTGPHGGALLLTSSMKQQALAFDRVDDNIFVSVDIQQADFPDVSISDLAKLLRCDADVLVSSPKVASVGSPKLLVEVVSEEVLYSLRPDLDGITEWGRTHGVNGCFAYSRIGPSLYAGRNFNHLDPALEDAATGVAAGALSVKLDADITLYQGRNLDNPCVIHAARTADKIRVGGRVATSR
ncbi:phenazine biosynthesis protein PhzF family [Burkholderia sp. D7]|nr:phenazine biosynthesis protein PhzF family [Burkholderia sp. D7]